jgi:hypothetical protein
MVQDVNCQGKQRVVIDSHGVQVTVFSICKISTTKHLLIGLFQLYNNMKSYATFMKA